MPCGDRCKTGRRPGPCRRRPPRTLCRARGQIIHIGSMAGQRVPPGAGLYAATKHAVRALTESLRMELHAAGDPIRVGEISPGFVETGFAARYHKSAAKATCRCTIS
ncbi:MAG: SDR family NAD(P)-dependent oxidoreductase [Pirellulales bacterium]